MNVRTHGIRYTDEQSRVHRHACVRLRVKPRRFSFRSFRWVLALVFAVGELNKTPGALPNLTLRAGVLDSCSSVGWALRGTAWLLSGGPGGSLSHRCWGPPPRLAAVLGDAGAEAAVSMGQVLGLYGYPQISYFTPPPELGNRLLFPSSLSVAPALSFQARGLAQLLWSFGWNWVGVLSQEEGGSGIGQAFLRELENMGVCLAFWEKVHSSLADVSRVASVVRHSTANVVVVFSLEAYLNPVLMELAFKGDTRARVWLSTEAWSTSRGLVAPQLSRFLRGTLGLVLRNGAAPGFKEFVFGLRPDRLHWDPFLREFWEGAFGCQWGLEDPASLQIFSDIDDLRVTYNVYKAVRMVAGALRDMATCREREGPLAGGHCADVHYFEPWQLLHYLRRVRLKGNVGDELYFDSLGQAPAIYDIINWQEGSSGRDSWPPVSLCSDSCPPGFRKAPLQGKPRCCFDCISCSAGEISNQTDSVDCFLCPDDQWPNAARELCVPRTIEFLSMSEPLGISLGTTSIVGSFLPMAVLLLFIRNRDTPLVRANNRALSFLLLPALALSFLCPLLLLNPPGPLSCLLRQAAFGMVFTLCVSCLLAKTLTVVLAFRANKPGGRLKVHLGKQMPILLALTCTIFQLALCSSWLALAPPFPERDGQSQLGKIIVQCNEGLGFWLMLGYLGILSSICFAVAFLARKLPAAFNEATHVTFSMLVFLSVWLSFVPAYLSTRGKFAVATEIFAILSSSAGLLLCIFSPKCYIILLRPQLNTRALVSGQAKKRSFSRRRLSPPDLRRTSKSH
ncbi:extracellular calcium-sensing receptor-like [Ascaphus truei]|uniref:extracellular calcium-sensing receptor-like n=1 Tax=Ascaphus truei TaxID=8439 RepID=UPI003F5A3D71